MRKQLNGIFPPITTPFINNEVAYDKLAENLSKFSKKNFTGYVVFGSNGENVFLTKDEKLKLISAVREQAAKDKIIIAGTGSDSIKETISLTNEVADLGVDYALIITPSFFKSEMKHRTFHNYYTAVAESVQIPVIIYNVPKFTNVNIETETVIELSHHPNIFGIKESSENVARISEIVQNTPESFSTIVGTASILYPGLSAGAHGGIVALANIAPDECIFIMKLISEGNHKEAIELQNRMIPLNRAVTTKFGVAGLKAAMDLTGLYGGPPRMPLEPLNELHILELKSILKKHL
jgi:4-hydroxy-2-oxoglutarate aldolase